MSLSKITIIAEAGVNHNGCLDTAKLLIKEAANAKVDYIKFQTFSAEDLVKRDTLQAPYQANNCKATSQFDMLKKLELSIDEFKELKKLANNLNIGFLSTAFDLNSIDTVHELNKTLAKIPSGQITDYPYLVKIAKKFPFLILSTGMANTTEIQNCLDVLYRYGHSKETITILHCTSAYPTPNNEVNLKTIPFLKNRYGHNVGLSDHSIGYLAATSAIALGAIMIEKHFTLDKNVEGPDHKASLNPLELKEFVNKIRITEEMLGLEEKKTITDSEEMNKVFSRKSIFASKFINKGDLLDDFNLTTKRPGDGISPMLWNSVIGTNAVRNFKADEKIEL